MPTLKTWNSRTVAIDLVPMHDIVILIAALCLFFSLLDSSMCYRKGLLPEGMGE